MYVCGVLCHIPNPVCNVCVCVCSVSVSSLCLCSQDTAAENEIIVLDEMSGVQSEGRGWPVEVLVLALADREVIVLNRCASHITHQGFI